MTLETEDGLPTGSFGSRGTELLRIIGEAMTNACRHAAAEHVVIRITGGETRLSVEVTDDGLGFDASEQPPAPHGQGLRGRRELAELLDVHSDHTGTTVRLQVTLSPA